jgi:hypothetical protein
MKSASLILAVILLIGGLSAYGYYYPTFDGEAQAAPTVRQRIYFENCAAYHGERGDGKGPEAGRLKTQPRDFTGGIYKFVRRFPVLFLWRRISSGAFLKV